MITIKEMLKFATGKPENDRIFYRDDGSHYEMPWPRKMVLYKVGDFGESEEFSLYRSQENYTEEQIIQEIHAHVHEGNKYRRDKLDPDAVQIVDTFWFV